MKPALRVQKKIAKLPDAPGVYMFLGTPKKKILYIGKATSLRDRVRSYFAGDIALARGPWVAKMTEEAADVEYSATDSVLEALILEAALIKKHQPPYNRREKDDKSWNYMVITKEEFPRVFTVRERQLLQQPASSNQLLVYGPFPHGGQLRDALKIIRKIFPYRGKTDAPILGQKQKQRASRLYEEMGLAPKFDVSKEEYRRTIRHLKLFFEGRKKELLKTIEREMRQYAKERDFEKANEMKRRLFALKHIQDVSLLKQLPTSDFQSPTSNFRIESYDIAHTSGIERVGVMAVVENGEAEKGEYRMFKIKTVGGGDTGALKEILERRLGHDEWTLPKLIVVDGGIQQKNAAERVLRNHGMRIAVVAVVKDEFHRPRRILGRAGIVTSREAEILLANAEAHRFALSFHRARRRLK